MEYLSIGELILAHTQSFEAVSDSFKAERLNKEYTEACLTWGIMLENNHVEKADYWQEKCTQISLQIESIKEKYNIK